MIRLFLIIVVIGAIALGSALIFPAFRQTEPESGSAPSVGAPSSQGVQSQFQKAPNFRLKDYSGKTVGLSDFQGRPLIINSWAAWCPFCKKELMDFVTIQKELGERAVIIAIDRVEPLATAKRYTDDLGVTDDLVFLLDPNDSFYASIGGFSMPETIFVDKDGNIRYHKRGPMELNEIRQRAQAILN